MKIKVTQEQKDAINMFRANYHDIDFFVSRKDGFSNSYYPIKNFSINEMAIILYGEGYEVIKKDSKEMKLNEYQELSERTYPTDKTETELINNFTHGLNGESGEVADIVKKSLGHGHALNKEHLFEELGDILFYISSMATLFKTDLSTIAQMNVDKLERRYPNGFNEKDSINRKE